MTWTPPTDDWSGATGYSVLLSAGAPAAPDQVAGDRRRGLVDLAGHQSPGTYWFTIRAVDVVGHWITSYATAGPYLIRAPSPVDFAPVTPAGWTRPLVLRNQSTGVTTSSGLFTSRLVGDKDSTWWSIAGTNHGEATLWALFNAGVYVDGIRKAVALFDGVLAGGTIRSMNRGPLQVPGGRHSLAMRWDATDAIGEPNETDNVHGRQYVFEPATLLPGSLVTRGAPPAKYAGADMLTEGLQLLNEDGLRMGSASAWNAVAIRPMSDADDYECRLHFATTSIDTGFGSARATSARGAGLLDAVVVNRRTLPGSTWDVGVLNTSGGTGNYTAEYVSSTALGWNVPEVVTLLPGRTIALRELYVSAGQVGKVAVRPTIIAGHGTLHLQWRSSTFTLGGLMGNATDLTFPSECARLSSWTPTRPATTACCSIATPGTGSTRWWWRSTQPGSARPAALCHLELVCAAGSAARGRRPAQAGAGARHAGRRRELHLAQLFDAGQPVHRHRPGLGRGARGRHGRVLAVLEFDHGRLVQRADLAGARAGPGRAPHADRALRPAGPDRRAARDQQRQRRAVGVVARVARTRGSGGARRSARRVRRLGRPGRRQHAALQLRRRAPPLFAASGQDGWWGAVAAMPGAVSALDLRLHETSRGAKSGFDNTLVMSRSGLERLELVLANFRRTPFRRFDAGIVRQGAWFAPYTVEAVQSTWGGDHPDGDLGPFALAPGHLVRVHEFRLAPGTHVIRLDNVTGTLNWGLSFHRADSTFQSRSTAEDSCVSWMEGAGASEIVQVRVPFDGYYAVAVWKASLSDLERGGSYRLHLQPRPVGVEQGLFAPTALAMVAPNPFAGAATLAFDLARDGRVNLAVFDLRGARVRTLEQAVLPAGRHSRTWDGRDDAGRLMRPGLYLVSFQAGGVSATRKLVRIE